MAHLHLYCDGAARGNPGPAAIGVIIYNREGQPQAQISKAIGSATNNVAEYRALIEGLSRCRSMASREAEPLHLKISMDSQLVVRQMRGEYRIKTPHLRLLFEEAVGLCRSFGSCDFKYIPRDQNRVADRLANRALDRF